MSAYSVRTGDGAYAVYYIMEETQQRLPVITVECLDVSEVSRIPESETGRGV